MGFPKVKEITYGLTDNSGGLLPVTIPSSTVAGDLIVIMASNTHTNPTGSIPVAQWTGATYNKVVNDTSSANATTSNAFWRIADGIDDSFTIEGGAALFPYYTCYCISNAYSITGGLAKGDPFIDPPAHGGDYGRSFLWISSMISNTAYGPYNAPTGYSTKVGGNNAEAWAYAAYKEEQIKTETPGRWFAYPPAIPPYGDTSYITAAVYPIPSKITIGADNSLVATVDGDDNNPNLEIKL